MARRTGGCVWRAGGNNTSNPAELRLMGRGSEGDTGVLVVSNRPHTGSSHCAPTWATIWLLDCTLWVCSWGKITLDMYTHTYTHTMKDCIAWAKGSIPKSRKRGPYQSTKGYPLSTKLSIMLIIKEKCLESRSFCGAGKREWMWSWEVENKLRTVLGSSFSYSATTYTLTGMLQPV